MIRKLYSRLPRSRQALIRQARTADNGAALEALDRLRARGWTQDGSLRGADFQGANLVGARLARADLEQIALCEANLEGAYFGAARLRSADFQGAILVGANLCDAHLRGACFTGADLRRAHLAAADLRGADLRQANLVDANLWHAALEGADLTGASLTGANLDGVRCDAHTILPDGSAWTPAADLRRFVSDSPTHSPDRE